jgi:hypothetical protein
MGAGLWIVVKGMKGIGGTEGAWSERRWKWTLALAVGAAFLTKVTIYPLAVVAAFAMLLRWRRQLLAFAGDVHRKILKLASGLPEQEDISSDEMPWETSGQQTQWSLLPSQLRQRSVRLMVRPLGRDIARVFVPALLLGALYWGRNVAVYGWPDFLGAIRHGVVVQGQPRTSEWIAAYGSVEVARRFVTTTFQSFWGQFGWMGVVMDRRVYIALWFYSALLAVGAVAALRDHGSLITDRQRDSLTLLGVSGLLTLAVYLYYNVSFVQHQGRYLFPALIPLGLAAAVGIRQWVKWIVQGAGRMGQNSKQWAEFALTLAPIVLMAALDLFALYRFIIPALR